MTARLSPKPDAKTELLEAAKRVLLQHGHAGLSTRAVATEAGTQMSQIRYHFGSKEGMVLALFEYMNAALIGRQAEAFGRRDLSVARNGRSPATIWTMIWHRVTCACCRN